MGQGGWATKFFGQRQSFFCAAAMVGGVFFNFPEGGWRHADNVQGGVLVNVQEQGCFSIFRRADDITRTMSKGGVLVNVFTPPPSGNPVSAPVICVKFRAINPSAPPNQSVPIRLWIRVIVMPGIHWDILDDHDATTWPWTPDASRYAHINIISEFGMVTKQPSRQVWI